MLIEAGWIGASVLSLLALGFLGCCCSGQQQQQQQVVFQDDEESKRVCPKCGLENPSEASYCGGCGFSFGKKA